MDSRKIGSRTKLDKKCDFCKGIEHTKDQCFKLIGYPEWFKKNRSVGSSFSSRMAANVTADIDDNPSDYDIHADGPSNYGGRNSGDNNMMQSIMHEFMKAMKNKQVIGESSNNNIVLPMLIVQL